MILTFEWYKIDSKPRKNGGADIFILLSSNFSSKDDSSHFEIFPSFQISWTSSDDFRIDEKFIHNCPPCLLAEMAKAACSVARPRKCFI